MRFIFKKLNNKGVTLIELVVAVGLFSFTMVAATQIFAAVLDGQREAVASQDMQESIRYTFERMSKEIRMANKDISGSCTGLTDRVYVASPAGAELSFLNYKGDCVRYFLENKRLRVSWDPAGAQPAVEVYITPEKLMVNNLQFLVKDNVGIEQSMVVLSLDLEIDTGKSRSQRLDIQTAISSRYYQ